MELSIIIVNYNSYDLLVDSVKSIILNTKDIVYEIIIVDNFSSQELKSEIQNFADNITLIRLKKNYGFGGANNIAAKLARGHFLFFLNPDTILIENSAKKLLDFYKSNKERFNIGALGCLLTDLNNNVTNSYGVFPSPLNILINQIKYGIFKKRFIFQQNYKESCIFVDYVSGADLFIERQLFIKMGKFSKEYFMYYEETDLQKKLSLNKYKQMILTTTKIIHLEGACNNFKNSNNFKRVYYKKSENTYLKKYYSRTYYLFKFIQIIWIIPILFNRNYSFNQNIQYIKEVIKY